MITLILVSLLQQLSLLDIRRENSLDAGYTVFCLLPVVERAFIIEHYINDYHYSLTSVVIIILLFSGIVIL